MTALPLAGLAAILTLLVAGCGRSGGPGTVAARPSDAGVPRFTDVAAASGVRFRQGHGGKRPLTILEATGSGCALFDYDNDGRLDLFLAGQPRCSLYRNNGNRTGGGPRGRRTDVRFTDVTERAGIRDRAWQTSCAWGDVDRDGWLDLYLCHYLQFGPGDPRYCNYAETTLKVTCSPDVYQPQVGVFYHNDGARGSEEGRSRGAFGTFTEATQRFGFGTAHGKAWGAAFADADGDGWQDLYVANDEMPGDLFLNRGGRVANQGARSGTAYSRDGSVQGGMGADFGDYDNDGRLDLVITTFWMEPNALYHNEGGGLFAESGYPAGIAPATLKKVGFGTRWVDLNNDGWLDLFFLNGHVRDARWVRSEEGMPQRMQLFLNQGGRRFRDVSAYAGEPFQRSVVGRGAAFGDIDNDGDVDIAAIDAEGAALLLHNDGPADASRRGHWLTVRALSAAGPRDALGARITLVAEGKRQVREVQTSGSVLSANDPRVHFGLGPATRVDRLTIRWPDGTTETRSGLAVDQLLVVRQRANSSAALKDRAPP